jgi:hypothetical protein
MKLDSKNEKILLEWFRLTGYIIESDKGNAKGNMVTTPSGTSSKSSSFSPAVSQQSSATSNKQHDSEASNKGDEKNVNKDGKPAIKNYKNLSTDNEQQATKKLEKNKEITKSIEKLDKPRDIASFLQGVLQTTVNDGKAKEQEVKNAVSLFARETLKKK